ncbi:MAG TPA: FAD/NAD(P)-binding oxidoreductase, partial [Streptosporangiaceae bacterium]|nr:FAD/NAD(P)-binding oxidoreductase [Streptosporangiaceae bacterium]
MKQIVILGGGTGGTLAANRLRRVLPRDEAAITVIDRDDDHLYQPGLLFVPFGLADPAALTRPRSRQLRPGIAFRRAGIDRVDVSSQTVLLDDGASVSYDVLVIATGAALQPEETEGLTAAMAQGKAFTFYELSGAAELRDVLARFDGGRITVTVIDMPIKCPVAPVEFSFLADWQFRSRGIRDRAELT